MKPKKTKIGTPPLNQLVADASLVLEDENEVHLTVEIEVGSFYIFFLKTKFIDSFLQEPSHGMHANLKKVAKVSYRAELEPRAASSVEVLKHSKDNSCRQVKEECSF